MKREYHNKFKYNVVLFYDIALDTDVLIGLFLVGITIITTLVVRILFIKKFIFSTVSVV